MSENVQYFAVVWVYLGIALAGAQILFEKDDRTKLYAAAYLICKVAITTFGWPIVIAGYLWRSRPSFIGGGR